jgi:hypothetical protein
MTQDEFLKRIESFLVSHNMKPSAFGWAAVKDPSLVMDLRKGRSPSLNLVARVQKFMDEQEQGEAA